MKTQITPEQRARIEAEADKRHPSWFPITELEEKRMKYIRKAFVSACEFALTELASQSPLPAKTEPLPPLTKEEIEKEAERRFPYRQAIFANGFKRDVYDQECVEYNKTMTSERNKFIEHCEWALSRPSAEKQSSFEKEKQAERNEFVEWQSASGWMHPGSSITEWQQLNPEPPTVRLTQGEDDEWETFVGEIINTNQLFQLFLNSKTKEG